MIEGRLYFFKGYAMEIHSYLKYKYFPDGHVVSDKVMIEAMLELILNLIRAMIYMNGEKPINYPAYDEESCYKIYADICKFDAHVIEEILSENILLDNLTTEIYGIISKNTWGLYAVDSATLECFGDWRILQWEKEHLDERGRYVNRENTGGS